jgi:hypothetical protein
VAEACCKGSAGEFLPAQETLGVQLVEKEVALSVAICAASAAAAAPPPPAAAFSSSSSSACSSSACSCRRRKWRRILTASVSALVH